MTSAEGSNFDRSAAATSTLLFIWRALRRYWRLAVLTTAVVAVAALVYALLTPPIYRASVTVVAADSDGLEGVGGLAALASQFGDIGQLGGLIGGSASLNEPLAVMRSRQLTDEFVLANNLLPELFHKRWIAAEQKWKPPSLLARGRAWLSGSPVRGTEGPTLWDAYREFEKMRRVRVDKTAGVTIVSIDWRDPELAAKWANELVRLTDNTLRTRALRDAQKMILNLEQQEEVTNLSEIRRSISLAVQQELKKTITASVRDSFAIKVIDQAQAPDERAWPRRSLILMLSLIGGAFMGCILALVCQYVRELRADLSGVQ